MFKHCLNLFKHGFRQVPGIIQVIQIKKTQKLIKHNKSKIGEYYHDVQLGKN